MTFSFRFAGALALALLAAGCATGELSGGPMGGTVQAATTPLTSVDVVLFDDPKLKTAGLTAILPPRVGENRQAAMSAAGSGIRTVMREASVGAEDALAAAGIPARVRLASRQGQAGARPSHVVAVTMKSATEYQTGGYTNVTLSVQVFEVAGMRLLWTGTADMRSSSASRPAERDEVDAAFGRGLVGALRESGAWKPTGPVAPLPRPARPQVVGVPIHIGDTVAQVVAALHTDRALIPAPKLLLGPTLDLADQGIVVRFGHDERVQTISLSPPYAARLGDIGFGRVSPLALQALGEPLVGAISPFGRWEQWRVYRLAGHERADMEFDKDGTFVRLTITG